jgi:aromatic-L-amino-acid/L-tryptophan decarboxylase
MSGYHMTPEEFRETGKAVVDWIADYYKWIESYPVLSTDRPGDVRRRLPERAPEKGEPFSNILQDMDDVVLPGITHWQSPNFFGYFPCNSSGPAVLGEMLSAGLNVQGMLWSTSPACTELETHVLDWLVDLLGLPDKFSSSSSGAGVIQDTASSASLCAVIAARERMTSGASNRQGNPSGLVAYTSDQAHSSIEKAIRIAGIGSDNLRLVPSDAGFAMRADLLDELIREDVGKGLQPFFVCATVGTTSSNGMDPLGPIGDICRRENIWLHVDGAMSGSATVCPEFRYILDGMELADSYCFNPHKWLFTNFDCNCFWVAERSQLVNALSILPEYLRNEASETDSVIDYRDWQIPLGRRFRSLKLWMVLRHYGREGLQYHIREHVRLAREFAGMVDANPDFDLASPHPLNLVCLAHRKGDAFTAELLRRVNSTGKMFASHTVLGGRYVIRMSIGQTNTEERHVASAWKMLRETASRMLDENWSSA